MPSFPKPLKRVLAALPVAALIVLSADLGLQPSPTQASDLCANTGSPHGPFDLQTYEDANHKTTYARTLELAGFNQLTHDRPGFSLPGLEVGGREAGSGQVWSPYIPPVLLKSIAWIESGWNQAAGSVQYGEVGPVLASHDCGYGIMQVTSGMQNVSGVPNLDQAMIGGHYGFNIARGARILAEKWNAAPEFRPIVGDRNINVLENWYYALWGYNGFAFKNHPLNPSFNPQRQPYRCDGTQPRSDYPYQELIIGCVNNPPFRSGTQLWSPQAVSLPNLSDPAVYDRMKVENWDPCSFNLQCAPMDIPTPNPWHTDPTVPSVPREQVFGNPVLSVSTGQVALVAVPGGQSLSASVSVSNSGSGLLAWRASASAPWLQVSEKQGVGLGPDLGGLNRTVQIHAEASGLSPGNYSGEVRIESLYVSNAPVEIGVSLQVSLQAGAVEVADFTGDGRSDALFLCCSDYSSMWIAQESGQFSTRVYKPWPGYGLAGGSWHLGHFNQDNRVDLMHVCCPGYVNLWLSNGDGTFSVRPIEPWPGYGTGGTWFTADFNGDTREDLAHNWGGESLNIWMSQGNGSFTVRSFQPWPGYGLGGSWQSRDFSGDGKTDLMHLWGGDYVNVWISQGNGTFSVSVFQPWSGYGYHLGIWRAGDFNGDNRGDIMHLCCGDYANSWISNGDGSFTVSGFRPWEGYNLQAGGWQSGDFNADGKTDLVHLCCHDYAHQWLSAGSGTFTIGSAQPWPGYGIGFGIWRTGYFNGDARTDLLHLCCPYANIWLAEANGFRVTSFTP